MIIVYLLITGDNKYEIINEPDDVDINKFSK